MLPDYEGGEGPWGTYYGPMMVRRNKDGQQISIPSLEQITPSVIAYWEERARSAKNPLLKCRYADLVWEFKRRVSADRPNIDFAWMVIDSNVEAVNGRGVEDGYEAEKKLERALALALSLKNPGRIVQVKDAIIKLPDIIEDEGERRRATVFAFEQMVGHKKISLSQEEEQAIVGQLERWLIEAAGSPDKTGRQNPLATEVLASHLGSYYRKLGKVEDVRRVVILYGETVEAVGMSQPAIQTTAWLRRVHQIYVDYGMLAEAEALLVKIQELARGINQELQTSTVETEIDPEELEQFLDTMTEGTVTDVLSRVAMSFTPDPTKVEEQVKDLAKGTIFMNLVPQQLLDREGRVIAEVGTVEDDLDGNVVLQLSRNMKFESQFLSLILERAKDRLDLNQAHILDFLSRSPLFPNEPLSVLQRGVEAYLQKDWLVAIHVFIPQVEQALRQLLVLLARPVMKLHRNGGLVLKILDEILRDPIVEETFTTRVTKYMRTLLCDQRGWNVRNDVCHGLTPPAGFNWMVADRLLHVLLLLGLVRAQEPSSEDNKDEEPRKA